MAGLINWLKSFPVWGRKFSSDDDDLINQRVIYIGHQPVYITGATGVSTADADQKDVNVAVAFRLVSDAIAGLPIVVEKKEIINGEESWTADNEHPVYNLLTRPNSFHDRFDIQKHILQSILSDGNCYIVLAHNESIVINEMWPIPPGKMLPAFDKKTGFPTRYLLDPFGKKVPFDLKDVLHIRIYDRNTPFLGVSPLKPGMEEVKANQYAVDFNGQVFQNGAYPGMLLMDKSGRAFLNQEERDEFTKSWNARHKGVKRAGRTGVLPEGIEPWVAEMSMKDMMYGEGIKLNREQIYALLGIYPSIGGVMNFAKYATALMESRSYWENTLIPKIQLIQAAYNRQICDTHFPKDDIRVRFDLTNVAALQVNKLEQAKIEDINIKNGSRTINEIRSDHGREGVEWGDEQPSFGPTYPEPVDGDQKNTADKFADNPKADQWKAFDKKTLGYEKKYSALISKYFTGQKKRILEALRKESADGYVMSFVLKKAIEQIERLGPDDSLPDDAKDIFDIAAETEALSEVAQPFQRQMVREVGQDAISEIGVDVRFDITNPRVEAKLKALWNRSKLINDTTVDDIKDILKEAYEHGDSLDKVSKNITELYGDYTKKRAMRIARTEMGGVVNGGSNEAYIQAKVGREWLTSLDGNERPAHAEANGQQKSGEEPFIVGGEALMHPLDPNGSAGNTINCRCTVIPII